MLGCKTGFQPLFSSNSYKTSSYVSVIATYILQKEEMHFKVVCLKPISESMVDMRVKPRTSWYVSLLVTILHQFLYIVIISSKCRLKCMHKLLHKYMGGEGIYFWISCKFNHELVFIFFHPNNIHFHFLLKQNAFEWTEHSCTSARFEQCYYCGADPSFLCFTLFLSLFLFLS